jgi:hypothetical protein
VIAGGCSLVRERIPITAKPSAEQAEGSLVVDGPYSGAIAGEARSQSVIDVSRRAFGYSRSTIADEDCY